MRAKRISKCLESALTVSRACQSEARHLGLTKKILPTHNDCTNYSPSCEEAICSWQEESAADHLSEQLEPTSEDLPSVRCFGVDVKVGVEFWESEDCSYDGRGEAVSERPKGGEKDLYSSACVSNSRKGFNPSICLTTIKL